MGLYELLTVSEGFKDQVMRDPATHALRRQAVTDGMRPLRLAGALRVAEGLTTPGRSPDRDPRHGVSAAALLSPGQQRRNGL
jgi:hypothetical protein